MYEYLRGKCCVNIMLLASVQIQRRSRKPFKSVGKSNFFQINQFNKMQNAEIPLKKQRFAKKITQLVNLPIMLLIIMFVFNSCFPFCKIYPTYTVSTFGLYKVDTPVNFKIRFGEAEIVNTKEDRVSIYRYVDKYVEFTWSIDLKRFHFDLKNKTNYSIKIPWDDVAFVNEEGEVMRLMHKGVKYIDRNSPQVAYVVPKNAMISDVLVPVDNVYYDYGEYGGWRVKPLFREYTSSEEVQNSGIIGKFVRIIFPIIIENVNNEYVFYFEITGVEAN
jgi:hypothetical protein